MWMNGGLRRIFEWSLEIKIGFMRCNVRKGILRPLIVTGLIGLMVLPGCDSLRVRNMTRPQLFAAMAPGNSQGMREAAALQIGRRGGAQGRPVLIKYLNDSDPDVQIKVMHALAVEMYDRQAAPLIAPLMDSPHTKVALKAISCIKHLDYKRALSQLRQLRDNSPNPHIASAAGSAVVFFERHR